MEISKINTCLGFIFFWFIILISNDGIEALNKNESDEGEGGLYRTGYHFQPSKNWMNDPNAPMYYNGIYHLFYQYNPKGAIWANIAWGHSVSTDLINWFSLDVAMYPTDSFDINGCWSGSATILPCNKPVILYTGIAPEHREVQNVAVPKNLSDPLLEEWIKPDYNPVMEPINGINETLFRDPTTAWQGEDGYWRVLVGNGSGKKGIALLYKSEDFIRWTKVENPLYSEPETGMMECPDFFPVSLKGNKGLDTSVSGDGIKHVLKASLGLGTTVLSDYYTIGRYIPNKDLFQPDNTLLAGDSTGLRLDYGKFYASKSFFDSAKNRRIHWGWVNESDTPADAVIRGWAGIMSIPRTLWLDENERQLLQWPVEELETLRTNEVQLTKKVLTKGSLFEVQGITAAQADVEVIFRLPSLENAEPFDPTWVDAEQLCGKKDATVQGGIGPFGLLTLASSKLEEYTAVFFRVFKAQNKHVVLMCSGGIRSSLNPDLDKSSYGGFVDVDLSDGELSLRTLIDHSVVESFGARGKTCIISRAYPILAVRSNAHLYTFNNGSEIVEIAKLKAWTMRTPKMNIPNSRLPEISSINAQTSWSLDHEKSCGSNYFDEL